MNKLKSIYVAALATVATCSAMPTTEGQLQAPVSDTFLCVNVSGLYMGAQDSDVYYDFAGFSIKLGLYITQTTEIFGECSIADACIMPAAPQSPPLMSTATMVTRRTLMPA